LTSVDTRNFLQDLGSLPIELDHARNDHPVLDLARTHNLTFYDAAYLELALRTRFPWATLDAALIAAAKSEGVPLVAAK
jgi:predicted nucleic acid-binding protein